MSWVDFAEMGWGLVNISLNGRKGLEDGGGPPSATVPGAHGGAHTVVPAHESPRLIAVPRALVLRGGHHPQILHLPLSQIARITLGEKVPFVLRTNVVPGGWANKKVLVGDKLRVEPVQVVVSGTLTSCEPAQAVIVCIHLGAQPHLLEIIHAGGDPRLALGQGERR